MFSRMKIFAKLMTGALLLATLTLVVGLIGFFNLTSANEAGAHIYHEGTEPISWLAGMTANYQQARVYYRDILLAKTPEEARQAQQKALERLDGVERLNAQFEKRITNDNLRQPFIDWTVGIRQYRTLLDSVTRLVSEGKHEEATKLTQDNTASAMARQQSLDKLTELKDAAALELHENSELRGERAKTVLIVVSLAAFLVALATGSWLARSIAQPLRRATALAASGELSTRLNIESHDEVGDLGRAFDAMAERLEQKTREAQAIASGDLSLKIATISDRDGLGQAFGSMVAELKATILEIHAASEQVATGAHEISDASQSLSQGATEQASSIEEISSSATEVGSQAQTSAENASHANRLVVTAREAAEKGDTHMKSMVSAMTEINNASAQIAKIIKVIDDIAFQTNLLALNAAVEAARAGKHGKGFAVVAEEVRNLAGRSAKAARETGDMIETAAARVENGLAVARVTSEVFGDILQSVIKTADLVGEIAAAGTEQAHGIAQISQGLSQIDQVTQRNTASAEELASTAVEVAAHANRVRELLSRFDLGQQRRALDQAGPPKLPAAQRAKARAASRPTADGAWASPPRSGTHRSVPPEDVVSLDDKEFGRY